MTTLEIYNLALSAINARGRLTSLTENKREAAECNLWYEMVVKTVQSAAFWSSCGASEALTRTSGPQDGYNYAYDLPVQCLRPRYLHSMMPFSITTNPYSFFKQINTNDPQAVLSYTFYQSDPDGWLPEEQQAIIHALAANIAGPITGRGELIQKNFNLANQFLLDAQANDQNSFNHSRDFVPSVIAARGYDGPDTSASFIYPSGNIFGVTA